MQNEYLERVINDLLAAIKYINAHPDKTKQKNYVQNSIYFYNKEVSELGQPFRRLFKKCGCTAILRRYCNNSKIEYEIRYLRFGYKIIVRSGNLKDCKRKFIEAANVACDCRV